MSASDHDDDKELATWRGEWQALGGKEDLAAALVTRAAKDGNRIRRAPALEVGAATLSTSACLYLMVRSHGAPQIVAMSAFILLFNGAWLTHFFTMRAGLFGSSGEGVEAFVELTRRRLAAQRRWTAVARRWILVILAAVVPWGTWVFVQHREHYFAEPWRAVIGYGGVFGILGAVLIWTRIKERRLRAEEEAFERHISDVQLA